MKDLSGIQDLTVTGGFWNPVSGKLGSASLDLDAEIWYLAFDSHVLVSRSGSQSVEAGIWHPGYDIRDLPSMIW